jgi:hypothetical protein
MGAWKTLNNFKIIYLNILIVSAALRTIICPVLSNTNHLCVDLYLTMNILQITISIFLRKT